MNAGINQIVDLEKNTSIQLFGEVLYIKSFMTFIVLNTSPQMTKLLLMSH